MLHEHPKAVLITGINGGIGTALHETLTSQGYKIIGLGRKAKPQVDCDLYICCDLSTLSSDTNVQNDLADQVVSYLVQNKLRLTALINNAAYQVVEPLDQLTIQDFHSTLHTNVLAPFVLAKLFQKQLTEAKGTIINIGSIHSKLTKPGFCAYSTSKAALAGLTRALALELAPDVRVNIVSPAATATEMLRDGFRDHPEKLSELEACHPLGCIAEPTEIAKMVLFLCSGEVPFMTGTDIAIDGGIGSRLHDPV